MTTGALWGRAGNIGGQITSGSFWRICALRVTQDPDTILASGAPKGVAVKYGGKNGKTD